MNETEKQIVAWLRGRVSNKLGDLLADAVEERDLEGIAGLIAADTIIPELANAIESGEHRQHSPAKDGGK